MIALRRLLVALALLVAAPAQADVAVPALTGRVVDQTATLSAEAVQRLDAKLAAFEARKGSQIAVLLVPTTAPETIEQFSIRVAEAWKIGRRRIDDGAILVIAKNDRKLRIEVGYGLEGALNDATTRRIIDEVITPRFRGGDFAGGIDDGVDRMIAVIDGEPLPPRSAAPRGQSGLIDDIDPFNPVLIFVAIFAGAILRAIFGRLLGSTVTGGVVGVLGYLLLGSLPVAVIAALIAFFFTLIGDFVFAGGGGFSSRGGGWSGGSSSGGGFSGGGGSFGGGGASGSW